MPYVPGHEEDGFLKKLNVSPADIEARADKCTKVIPILSHRFIEMPVEEKCHRSPLQSCAFLKILIEKNEVTLTSFGLKFH
jgi:hypothetical protein